jgi:hypothetical protein
MEISRGKMVAKLHAWMEMTLPRTNNNKDLTSHVGEINQTVKRERDPLLCPEDIKQWTQLY